MCNEDINIVSPREIPHIGCEYFILAAKTKRTAINMRTTLHEYGIDDKYIIWQEDSYRKSNLTKM